MKVKSLNELNKYCEDFLKKYPEGGIFALKGDLGAGKTTFVRTLVEVLSLKAGKKSPRVTSPTYVYHQAYELSKRIEHFDLYRLEHATETDLMSIGYPEACERVKKCNGFLFVEWPEKVTDQKLLHLNECLNFIIISETERVIED